MKATQLLLIVPALVVLSLMTACGPEKLNRDKAATLIKEFYGYPRVEIDYVQFSSQPVIDAGWGYQKFYFSRPVFYFNEVAGPFLVGSTERSYNGNVNEKMIYAEVVANCNDFVEITGTAFDEQTNTAKVEFTARRIGVTPLGEFAGRRDGDILTYSVTMQLYDDGWRITAKKLDNIKPESYPFFNQDGTYKQPASIN